MRSVFFCETHVDFNTGWFQIVVSNQIVFKLKLKVFKTIN